MNRNRFEVTKPRNGSSPTIPLGLFYIYVPAIPPAPTVCALDSLLPHMAFTILWWIIPRSINQQHSVLYVALNNLLVFSFIKSITINEKGSSKHVQCLDQMSRFSRQKESQVRKRASFSITWKLQCRCLGAIRDDRGNTAATHYQKRRPDISRHCESWGLIPETFIYCILSE